MLPRWLAAGAHLRRLPEVWRAARRLRGWPRVLWAYLRLGTTRFPLELHPRGGMRFSVRDFHDLVTAWVVYCRDEYAVDPGARCVVDLGANYGAFTLWAAAAAPGARIVGVEPQPVEHGRLQGHVSANRLEGRVSCWRVAVGPEDGERWMTDDPTEDPPSRALLPEDPTPPGPLMRVRTATLGALLDRVRQETGAAWIDLVKMDVEGAEHEFLPDLAPEVLAPVLAWQMEYHPNGPREPLFAALERAGLHLVRDRRFHPNSGVAWFRRSGADSPAATAPASARTPAGAA